MDEGNEKEEVTQPKKTVISITVPGVPLTVNKKIAKYRKKINFERNKDFNQMQAYAEWLKESTKDLAL